MTGVEVGDRIILIKNGRDNCRWGLGKYASGIVLRFDESGDLEVKFDNGCIYCVGCNEEFEVVPLKEKVIFT